MSHSTTSREQAAVGGLLDAIAESNGAPLPDPWASAITSVPRHLFLPRVIWQHDDQGGYATVDADAQPDRWFAAAYADDSIVTQVNDGEPVDEDTSVFPSSSTSAPSIVAHMLTMLAPKPGQRVLEVGTGTGWNAALLAHVLGAENVTTVEVDRTLAEQAATVLNATTPGVRVVCGDGTLGHPDGGPYDHVEATCSLNGIPAALLAQTKPGGTILTPWSRPWCDFGLLHLTVDEHGGGLGHFSPYAAFMRARGHRLGLRLYHDIVADEHQPTESRTRLTPWDVADDDHNAQFAIGLRLPDLWHIWHHAPDVEGVETRLWVATTDKASWAAIDYDGNDDEEFTVWQHGQRRLWDEIESAWHWYTDNGRPTPDRFGMTVATAGHAVWLDTPGNVIDASMPV
ncbi:methyltransferase domain-containing protein [Streptomyces olivoreticuli]|uniref:methyltransferase domain-containing protein n=1 Tax=Streptomyces olivoreticuli TaxID=68246 RepID=UPI0026587BB0|nr:methyltransferase domain-containing protein [Streptomyces olivoreticuli]WKK22989.1 methyltransferase domain-containing protein [Streptomyces olivoreticuli]